MNLPAAQAVVADLELNPHRIELFSADREAFIAWTKDAVFKLTEYGADGGGKTRVVALEYRVRLLLERRKKKRLN